MKASEAKLLTAKYQQLILTVTSELCSLHNEIRESALNGLSAINFYRGYLNSTNADSEYVTRQIILDLQRNGYCVKLQDSSRNKPWLLISWL